MKVFKTIYLIAIITITVLVVGLFGARRFGNWFGFFGGQKMVEAEVDLEPFKSIELEGDVADFSIVEGDDYHVEYKYPSNITVTGNVENDVLKVKVKGKQNSSTGLFVFDKRGINTVDTTLVVYVPEGTQLDKVDLQINAGNVKISDFNINTLKADCDAANMELSEITSDNVDLVADAGNLEMDDCIFGDCKMVTSAGNISLDHSVVKDLEAETSMGRVELFSTTFEKGKINSNLGEISVDGSFNELTAETDMGKISVECENLDEAKLDLSVDLGEITVNGLEKGSHFEQD